ncbi:hypothetical protein CANCADRAFT_30523 [Tortispora caseinolytica NRRL Y-17796]|uniref:serine C-palmitoyltransferase n=1 Tax=Tortispora caseinolytica NRRL Y-17796 TaxID=767744 RepID=A0A1E4TL24_9ASCO|nr:hypothetical protein CANCADRAFT_30523 [Tortispora caseinolytica NRRL Y-17796]
MSGLEKINATLHWLSGLSERVPGAAMVGRYIQRSHQNDPVRTALEIGLALFAIRYFLASRKAVSKRTYVPFTEKEVDELVEDWYPEPLVPESLDLVQRMQLSRNPILVGANGPKTHITSPPPLYPVAADDASPHSPSSPGTDSASLVTSSSDLSSDGELIAPHNAIPPHYSVSKAFEPIDYAAFSTKEVVNFALPSLYSFDQRPEVKANAIRITREYGVGVCGPTGFYGYLDVQISLEKRMAAFLGTEDVVIYTQALATATSVLPAFCKRGDIVVADQSVNFAIQKGIQISRCTAHYFAHNDLRDLENILEKVYTSSLKRKPLTRHFLVIEGIYDATGQIPNVPEILKLAKKYKFRIILDQTWSLGVLGDKGKGILSRYNIDPTDIDITIGSLAHSLGSGGGFCAGSNDVVAHQRINSPAVVFSAALPAVLANSAEKSLDLLESEGDKLLADLQKNIQAVRAVLSKVSNLIKIMSDPDSPLIIVQVKHEVLISVLKRRGPLVPEISYDETFEVNGLGQLKRRVSAGKIPLPFSLSGKSTTHRRRRALSNSKVTYDAERVILQEIIDLCLQDGVLLSRQIAIESLERRPIKPALKIIVPQGLTVKECEKSANVVKSALQKVLGKKH